MVDVKRRGESLTEAKPLHWGGADESVTVLRLTIEAAICCQRG